MWFLRKILKGSKINLAAILNFRIKQKSYKIWRTTQMTFLLLKNLVLIGLVVCEKKIQMWKII